MQIQVVTVHRQTGTGKQSGRAYDFWSVGGLIDTAKGPTYCEVIVDGSHPAIEVGKRYDVQFSFYADREKKLTFTVEGLRPVVKS